MNSFLNILINQILRQPAIVMGIVVLIGNLALKKKGRDILVSTVKAVVGMLILSAGSGILIAASRPLMSAVFKAFGVTGVLIDPWTMVGEIEGGLMPASELGYIGAAMAIGMFATIILARITPIKTIYLTGHVAYSDTVTILYMVWVTLGLTSVSLFVVTTVILILYWWLGTWLFIPVTRTVVDKDTPITVGHNLLFGTWLATLFARLFKKNDNNPSCEELNLPGWLSIFSDAVMGYSIVMGLMFTIIAIVAGPAVVGELSGGMNYILFGLMQGLQVAVGMTILLSGVRMFLAELMPAFKGFADRLVPGAIAAIDTPAFWSYAPNSTLVGFISTTIGMFIGTGLLIVTRSPIVAFPSIIPMFFGGSTMGVFCNARGGWKGTVLGTFLLGVIVPPASAWFASIAGTTVGIQGHSDWGTLWAPIFQILEIIGGGR